MSGIIGVSPDMKSGVIGAFPTGQIVKCHDVVIGAGADISYSASEAHQASGISLGITFKAGNKIFAIGNVYLHIYGGGDDVAGRSQLYDATNSNPASGFGTVGESYAYSGATSATPQIITNVPSMGTLSPPSTSVTISIGFGLTSGATVVLKKTASSLVVFEIQA